MFRRWVPISFIVVAIALALAGGAVLAAGGGEDGRRSDVFEHAAEILGIGPSKLEDAHDQATRELRDEQLASIIEKMVSDGLIERGEADSFAAWMADRPEAADEALFSSLTSSAFNLRSSSLALAKLELPRLGLHPGGDVIARMAEILGVDVQELTGALESGASGSASGDRLAAMHTAIDDLLESGSVTPDEATELHTWVDEIPGWLLDIDLGSRILPALGFGHGERVVPGGLFGLPFGRDHFERGDRDFFFGDGNRKFEFDFEFRGPEGTFRFGPGRFGPGGIGPGEHGLPFDEDLFSDGRFRDFFDGFDFERFNGIEGFGGLGELENLEDLEDLFKRFRGPWGHGFSTPPSIGPDGTGEAPESSSTSA